MAGIVNAILDAVDTFFAWASTSLRQTTAAYCDIQTADSPTVLVAHDGSLISVLKLRGVKTLIGTEEFDRMQGSLQQAFQTTMSRPGHTIQVLFSYNKDGIEQEIT